MTAKEVKRRPGGAAVRLLRGSSPHRRTVLKSGTARRSMSDTRLVWWVGQQVTFHPSKTKAHHGFVYRNGRRRYGVIEFTGVEWLGWQFTTNDVIAAGLGYQAVSQPTSV